jgi:putative pyruvate formate lyase activating enzyme
VPAISAAEVKQRAEAARARLASCDICPRRCGVNRLRGEKGYCGVGRDALVSSHGPHFGEERPLVGRGGSGTVFFAGCNLLCLFCQNDDISHGLAGRAVSEEELARVFLAVAAEGCHNLNLVTPSHVAPQILAALARAMDAGFDLPVVFNTGGYDALETLALFDGVVDIYMPDYKFADAQVAQRLAEAPDYPEVARAALREMHRQVGDLELTDSGLARRGLLVRHLVMPHDLAGTAGAMRFLAKSISRHTYVNIMGQYRPCHLAHEDLELRRRPTAMEIEHAFAVAREAGLWRFDKN